MHAVKCNFTPHVLLLGFIALCFATMGCFTTTGAHAQTRGSSEPSPSRSAPNSMVLKNAPAPPISDYFLQVRTLGGVTLPGRAAPDRPDSDLPKATRYVLGTVFASVSVASLVGGIYFSAGTVALFQSDAPLSNSLGILSGMMGAGALGFSIASGVWSVRLFRGKTTGF